MEKAVTCMREGERTSFWTPAKIKLALFRGTSSFQTHKQSTEETRYVSRHFRRRYLKANKVSKSEATRKVEYVYNFRKCADAVYPKLSKSVHAWRNYSLPKLGHFWYCIVAAAVSCVHQLCCYSATLLFYYFAVIRGALSQTVPEHPKKENVFAISTVVGDVFLFQASAINFSPFIVCLDSCSDILTVKSK